MTSCNSQLNISLRPKTGTDCDLSLTRSQEPLELGLLPMTRQGRYDDHQYTDLDGQYYPRAAAFVMILLQSLFCTMLTQARTQSAQSHLT